MYFKKLGIDKYEKNLKNVYELLKPYLDVAIYNAKQLEQNFFELVPSKMAPSTKVYEIFEKLKAYL